MCNDRRACERYQIKLHLISAVFEYKFIFRLSKFRIVAMECFHLHQHRRDVILSRHARQLETGKRIVAAVKTGNEKTRISIAVAPIIILPTA